MRIHACGRAVPLLVVGDVRISGKCQRIEQIAHSQFSSGRSPACPLQSIFRLLKLRYLIISCSKVAYHSNDVQASKPSQALPQTWPRPLRDFSRTPRGEQSSCPPSPRHCPRSPCCGAWAGHGRAGGTAALHAGLPLLPRYPCLHPSPCEAAGGRTLTLTLTAALRPPRCRYRTYMGHD